jgi:hypothetical protein
VSDVLTGFAEKGLPQSTQSVAQRAQRDQKKLFLNQLTSVNAVVAFYFNQINAFTKV